MLLIYFYIYKDFYFLPNRLKRNTKNQFFSKTTIYNIFVLIMFCIFSFIYNNILINIFMYFLIILCLFITYVKYYIQDYIYLFLLYFYRAFLE